MLVIFRHIYIRYVGVVLVEMYDQLQHLLGGIPGVRVFQQQQVGVTED